MPNVVGMPFDRAKSRLTRFSVERAERPRTERSSAPEGQVSNSRRAQRRAHRPGSAVVLTVSSAPRATVEIFEMPNVVGAPYTDAARSLAEFKVSRTAIASTEARGQIVAQTPAPGATLLPGDQCHCRFLLARVRHRRDRRGERGRNAAFRAHRPSQKRKAGAASSAACWRSALQSCWG